MTDSKCGAHSRRRNSAAVAAGSFALIAVLAIAGPAFADEPGWVLTQRSEQMGDMYIYVSANGFKWVNPKVGANVVTTAPNWNVTMFNEKSKMYYETTFDNWKRQIANAGGQRAAEMRSNPWVPAGAGVVAGLKATKYTMKGGGVANVQRMKNGNMKRTLSNVQGAECWVSEEVPVPAVVAGMLSQAYGMPQTKYFPLKVTYMNGGRPGVALDTLNSKSCNIPANYWIRPQSCNLLAKSQAEIWMDDETKQILRDMAGELEDSPRGGGSGGNNAAVATPTPAPVARPAATPGNAVALPGGFNVDKDKLSKLLQQLKNGGNTKPPQK